MTGTATEIRALLEQAVAAGRCTAVAAAFGRGDHAVFEATIGPVDATTPWDLASLTKVLATTPAVLRLAGAGALALEDRADAHVEWLRGAPAGAAPIERLLTHTAGLPVSPPRTGTLVDVLRGAPVQAPGTAVVYGDVAFLALGAVVEAVTGVGLAAAFERHISGPLALRDTTFGGAVHDPTARRLGGLAGHAGMFASLRDVITVAGAWLADGWIPGDLRAAALAPRTEPLPGGRRGLGWCLAGDEFHCAGPEWPVSHSGFTGTSIVLDPATGGWAVLLTDLLPDGDDATEIMRLRRAFHGFAAAPIGCGA